MASSTDPSSATDGSPHYSGVDSEGLGGDRVMRFEQSIDIDRPVEDVFTYLADFTNIPRWNYYVERVRQLRPGPVGAGTTYEQIRRTDRQRFAVTVYSAPRLLAVTTLPGERPAFHRRFELQSIAASNCPAGPAGTRLNDRWELDLGYLQTLQRLATPRVRSAVGDNLAVLKRLLEQGASR